MQVALLGTWLRSSRFSAWRGAANPERHPTWCLPASNFVKQRGQYSSSALCPLQTHDVIGSKVPGRSSEQSGTRANVHGSEPHATTRCRKPVHLSTPLPLLSGGALQRNIRAERSARATP